MRVPLLLRALPWASCSDDIACSTCFTINQMIYEPRGRFYSSGYVYRTCAQTRAKLKAQECD